MIKKGAHDLNGRARLCLSAGAQRSFAQRLRVLGYAGALWRQTCGAGAPKSHEQLALPSRRSNVVAHACVHGARSRGAAAQLFCVQTVTAGAEGAAFTVQARHRPMASGSALLGGPHDTRPRLTGQAPALTNVSCMCKKTWNETCTLLARAGRETVHRRGSQTCLARGRARAQQHPTHSEETMYYTWSWWWFMSWLIPMLLLAWVIFGWSSRRGFARGDYLQRGDGSRYDADRPSRGALARLNRGRGPRGYVRSDARILDDLCDQLTLDDQLDASAIEVDVDQGIVQLRGRVESRYDKRRAEAEIGPQRARAGRRAEGTSARGCTNAADERSAAGRPPERRT